MRWKIKETKIGDTRIVKKFLILPLTLPTKDGSREKRWLETVRIVQRFERCAAYDGWTNFRWED